MILSVVVAAVCGAAAGFASSWVGVKLERVEKLEQEEADERLQYERDVATAMEEGMPLKIRSGVSRNPPPTPSMPDRMPITIPRPRRSTQETDI